MSKLNINILYAEKDDQPIMQTKGWVSYFEKFLYMMLKQTMDRPIQINRVSDEMEQYPESAELHIPILSPDFILSGICLDRLEQLFHGQKNPAIEQNIFTVYKSPLDYVDIPEKLRVLNDYIFYISHEDEEHELLEFFSKEAERGYWMKMVDLCFDIYERVIAMSNQNENIKTKTGRKAIYLAETGQDLAGARNIIKRELNRHGYEVYPKSILPHSLGPLKKAVEADLEKCQFSIHMVGSSYGTIPNGGDSSVMDLQNGLAADRAEEVPDEFSRLIWISPALKYASEQQKAFIHNLKRDARASLGAEVLQTSLEDFKNTLWEELIETGINKKLRKKTSTSDKDQALVYLIYDPIDEAAVQPLKEKLAKKAIKIISLSDGGGLMDLRNKHIDALKQMDAAIVFQQKVNDQWVFMKLLDLMKAPGFGRLGPILGKLFVSAKSDKAETYMEKYEVDVDTSDDFKKLDAFVKDIEASYQQTKLKMAEES